MSLGSNQSFEVDEKVRKVLKDWGQARDSDLGRLELKRALQRLDTRQREQLVERLAEISLGLLFTIHEKARRRENAIDSQSLPD